MLMTKSDELYNSSKYKMLLVYKRETNIFWRSQIIGRDRSLVYQVSSLVVTRWLPEYQESKPHYNAQRHEKGLFLPIDVSSSMKQTACKTPPADLPTLLISELLPVPMPGRERKETMATDLDQ